MFKPNRIAVYLMGLAGIAGAVAVPLANLDTTSTASVLGGVFAVCAAGYKFLTGWIAYEEREHWSGMQTGVPAQPSE
jgi:hypothetical protein